MKPSITLRLATGVLAMWLIAHCAHGQTWTIILKSDESTLAAALGSGAPSSDLFDQLDRGDISGLSFQEAVVGDFGTSSPVPNDAPLGTQVINIPPGDGENGFFKTSFVLPAGFQAIQLSGSANVDDYGRAFLNGNPISSSMSSDDSGRIAEFGDTQFSTANAAFFVAGTNELVIADANTGDGPSGAAFYAVVTYQTSTNNPGLVLTVPRRLGNGQFQFTFNNESNVSYTIQYSTTLTNWNTLYVTNAAGTSVLGMDNHATNSRCFYRVKVGP